MRIIEIDMLNKPKSLTERVLEMIKIPRKANPAQIIFPADIKMRCPANLDLNKSAIFKDFMGRIKP